MYSSKYISQFLYLALEARYKGLVKFLQNVDHMKEDLEVDGDKI